MLTEVHDKGYKGSSSGLRNQNNAYKNAQQILTPQKLKFFMVVGAVVVLLLVTGGMVTYLMGEHTSTVAHDSAMTAEHSSEKNWSEVGVYGMAAKSQAKAFIDMEPFMATLNIGNSSGKGASLLRLKIKLEIENSQDRQAIEGSMPKIRDIFQGYLRELRPSDLQGSVGLYRLREELLLRVNKLVDPIQVADILFDEVLVQ